MATISDLPIELLLDVFILLPLPALIVSRTVIKRWRELVAIAPIFPSRRRLLELYTYAIDSPGFLKSRAEIISALTDLNREKYITTLESRIGAPLPDDFRIWLLEWPARAVIGWFWPGLSSEIEFVDTLARRRGEYGLQDQRILRCALLPELNAHGIVTSYQRWDVDDDDEDNPPADTPDWLWMVELHATVLHHPGWNTVTSLVITAKGVGEPLVGQVLALGDDRVYLKSVKHWKWIDFLKDEPQWKTRIVRSQQVARGRGCDQLRPAAKIWTICDLARAQSNVVAG
ncbi:hypothetical protein BKA93DRAFT_789893 [Sparassis latifolia]